MATKNKDATRFYSHNQELAVCNLLGGRLTSNSGASAFDCGDVIVEDSQLLIECKTTTSEKSSFSIKEDWIKKNKEEAFSKRFENSALAFNFGPNKPNYFVIDEKLMAFLCEKLEEEYSE